MRWPGFLGPSATARSVTANAERTINLFGEAPDGGGRPALYGTPGLRVFTQAGGGPIRALWSQDGRVFCVSGARLYEILPNGTATSRGTVRGGSGAATICSNGTGGHQLLITASNVAYVYDLDDDSLTALADPTPAAMGAFLDGYFILLLDKSPTFRFSALEDGTSWDALDVAQRSFSTDTLRAMCVNHRELWLFGSRTTEVWYNAGDPDVPLVPVQGAFVEAGIAGTFTAARLDNALFWLGQDERGQGIVWRANGYTPQRVSTHPVETALASASTLEHAVAYAYQEEGHAFYVLYVPGLDTTWVYDAASGLWHERAHWDERLMRWVPHVGRCHAEAFNTHLIGDRQSGAIYEQRLDVYDEDLVVAGA